MGKKGNRIIELENQIRLLKDANEKQFETCAGLAKCCNETMKKLVQADEEIAHLRAIMRNLGSPKINMSYSSRHSPSSDKSSSGGRVACTAD